jgi:uncharacterized Fe-S cluster protein YjdI
MLTHSTMDSERTGSNDRDYTNDEITVSWKPSKCIHATTCYRELIEVFNPRKRPWVNMKGASTREIIRVVELCPTSALTYKWNKEINPESGGSLDNKTDPAQHPEIKAAEVKIMKDGPLIVKGDFKIIGSDGTELRQMKMASFCRCGHSNNMPFCDGTHRKVSFSSD